MEIVKVGILLEDRAFAQALSIALSREDSCMRFYLLDSAAEGESCDLILAERPSSDEKVIELVRDSEAVRYTGDPPYKLYRYMESQNLINSLLFTGARALARQLFEYFFYYLMWGYPNASLVLVKGMLPTVLYTLAVTPLFFWGVQKLYGWYKHRLDP